MTTKMMEKVNPLAALTESVTLEDAVLNMGRDSYFTEIRRYSGALGAIYGPESTHFRLWAPTASQVEVLVYDGYYGPLAKSYLMERNADQTAFELELAGDCHGLTYNYRLTFVDGSQRTSVDPYARTTTVNGRRSVVVDLSQTDPENWSDHRMEPWLTPEKTVVYETHVRDFTVSDTSNITHKGKFLGVVEEGRVNDYGSPAGLDYVKSLGVTHVEFLPFFDFYTVDETEEPPQMYNWGYDPLNYNSPEGSYARDPYDPILRIKDLKQMIQGLHDSGLRVIMDVVYNHVYETDRHAFHLTVPGYYFRYNAEGDFTNGTGVGNDTASERYMVRKYIVDSVTYWAREYKIDGFRFDLMGIHDLETMEAVREALDAIDPSILVFGEGWHLYTPLPISEVANQGNAYKLPRVGHFNDGLRDALKGNDFFEKSRGFVSGGWNTEKNLVNHFMGGMKLGQYDNPLQLVQYVECHDNMTLYDKLMDVSTKPGANKIQRRHALATSIILLSQGIPFIHAGQEFLRTKEGIRDSYNQPDAINAIDWNRQEAYGDTVQLVRDLIRLRQDEPLLRLTSFEEISQVMSVVSMDHLKIHLVYESKEYDLHLFMNGHDKTMGMDLYSGTYQVLVDDHQVYLDEPYMHKVEDYIFVRDYSITLMKYSK